MLVFYVRVPIDLDGDMIRLCDRPILSATLRQDLELLLKVKKINDDLKNCTAKREYLSQIGFGGLSYGIQMLPIGSMEVSLQKSEDWRVSLWLSLDSDELPRIRSTALINEACRKLIHDLAQPLQAIYTFGSSLTRLMENEPTMLPEKPTKWITTLFGQAERMVNMIKTKRHEFTPLELVKASFNPNLAVSVITSKRLEHFKRLGLDLSHEPLPINIQIRTEAAKFLAALELYFDVLIARFQFPEPTTVEFGFETSSPDDDQHVVFKMTFPLIEGDSVPIPKSYDQASNDLGLGFLALKRLMGELGVVKIEQATVDTDDEIERFPLSLRVSIERSQSNNGSADVGMAT